jgi:hypothetical protein
VLVADAAYSTGATDPYERVGMRVVKRLAEWARTPDPWGASAMSGRTHVERGAAPSIAGVVLVLLSLVLLPGCADRVENEQGTPSPRATTSLPAARHLLTVAGGSRSATGFSFASGKVYWASLSSDSSGLPGTHGRVYSFDPATGVTTPLRRLERIMASRRVSDMAFAPGRVAVLAETVIFRAADGTDGFRGVLGQPLFAGSPSGAPLKRVGPASVALVGNGGLGFRSGLSLSSEALVWLDGRYVLPTGSRLPQLAGSALPELAQARDAGLWVHTFADGRTHRVAGYRAGSGGVPALAGHTAYWPTRDGGEAGPIMAADLISGSRTQVPGSETLVVFDDDQRCVAASQDVVVWTTRTGSGRSLAGFDRRTGHALPRFPAAAVPTDPAVGADLVVWLDRRRGPVAPAVYGLDLRTGREFAVALDKHPKSDLAVDGDAVYWWSGVNPSGKVALYGVRLTRTQVGVTVSPL